MKQYLALLRKIKTQGVYKSDRTGTGVYSIFGHQMRFDLAQGFPLITTKLCAMRLIIHELLWFLKGDTQIDYLQKNNVHIWDQWATDSGDLGAIYGKQWRSWETGNYQKVDQISQLIYEIKKNPTSRRLVISAWNPSVLPDSSLSPQANVQQGKQALPPCHCLFQFNIQNNKLSCQLYQRSADIFLGVPFNIASYALLTLMIAQVCNLELGEFIHTFGDVHLYANHVEQARIQLTRTPYPLPIMVLNPDITDIFSFDIADFSLKHYQAHPHIKANVAV